MDNTMIRKLTNIETGEQVTISLPENVEFINPTIYFKENYIINKLIENRIPFEEIIGKEKSKKGALIFLQSEKFWDNEIDKMNKNNLAKELVPLLSMFKKKHQLKQLEGKVVTPQILLSLIYEAYLKFGFSFSQFTSEMLPKGTEISKLPIFYEVTDGRVLKYGKTEYSDNQLKAIIEQRNKIVAIFLDKGKNWHCFFTTFKSLRAEETWLNQKIPHFHYISDSFGMSREKLIKQLESGHYKLNTLPHIELINYR